MINDHKIPRRVWKIQINMHVNFIFSKDTGETCIYYIWSDNVSIIQGENTNDIIREIFNSFLNNYQKELKNIKGSGFVFESVDLLDYELQRVRLKRGGSYIKSSKWLENKKATINPKNENDDECLRWSIISPLNYNDIMIKELETYLKRLNLKIKIFHRIKEIRKNLNKIMNQPVLMYYSEEIVLLYKSEYNLEQKNKVLLLMINDDEKYYLLFCIKKEARIMFI